MSAMSAPSLVTQRIVNFTTPGANSWVVPANVTGVVIRKLVSGGGGGGGGQASADTAGGGGSGGGGVICDYPVAVTPGATLPITIGAVGACGV